MARGRRALGIMRRASRVGRRGPVRTRSAPSDSELPPARADGGWPRRNRGRHLSGGAKAEDRGLGVELQARRARGGPSISEAEEGGRSLVAAGCNRQHLQAPGHSARVPAVEPLPPCGLRVGPEARAVRVRMARRSRPRGRGSNTADGGNAPRPASMIHDLSPAPRRAGSVLHVFRFHSPLNAPYPATEADGPMAHPRALAPSETCPLPGARSGARAAPCATGVWRQRVRVFNSAAAGARLPI